MKPLGVISKMLIAFTLPFAAAYYFLVIPQVQAVGDGFAKVAELQNQNTATLTAKQREAFKAKLDGVKEKAGKLLPVADEQSDLSVQVEALAKAEGVAITALSTNAAVATNLPKTTPVKEEGVASDAASTAPAVAAPAVSALKVSVGVSVTGNYDQVQAFTAGLTRLERFIQVDQVTMNNSNGVVTTAITAYAFYLPKQQ